MVKTLGRLVPVGAYPLRCKLDLVLVLSNDFAEPEVGDFDFPVVKDDVLWFEIVVDDYLLLVVQVLEAGQDLGDDQLRFFLLDLLILL